MEAAEKAAADLLYASSRTPELLKAITALHSDFSFEVVVDKYEGADQDEDNQQQQQQQQQKHQQQQQPQNSTQDSTPPASWLATSSRNALNTIYGIPFAGRLVNASVSIGLSGFNPLSKSSGSTHSSTSVIMFWSRCNFSSASLHLISRDLLLLACRTKRPRACVQREWRRF
jgi:hypothetical protein